MPERFTYDVFLSHSARDKRVAREIAERLRGDGLSVWLDEWSGGEAEVVEEALEHSRVLVLLISRDVRGREWQQREQQTLRFRDPSNAERRFVPVRVGDAPLPDSIGWVQHIHWGADDAYPALLAACAPRDTGHPQDPDASLALRGETTLRLPKAADMAEGVQSYRFRMQDGAVLTACGDGAVRIHDVETGMPSMELKGHDGWVSRVDWSADGRTALSSGSDGTIRLWDLERRRATRRIEATAKVVDALAWHPDEELVLSGARDMTVRVWSLADGEQRLLLNGHTNDINAVVWSPDFRRAASCSDDMTVRIWDLEERRCERVLEGHRDWVLRLAWMDDGRLISTDSDGTIRFWDVESGRTERVLEGHTTSVWAIALHPSGHHLLTGSRDQTVRLWDLRSGECLSVVEGGDSVRAVEWFGDAEAVSGDIRGLVRTWDFTGLIGSERPAARPRTPSTAPAQVHYTNAKVVLVGESGAGKTGLAMRLAADRWEPSDSTVGAWATQWKVPVSDGDTTERDIWLWDFGGQADQRLIHQLYMDDTAVAVLVFDGQREDAVETLRQWDRDLGRATAGDVAKILAAGRVDAGGIRGSRDEVETFADANGYATFIETSAKRDIGCGDLRDAIFDAIDWTAIPWRSTPLLFQRLREEIIALKDSGRVLMRFNELRDTLAMRLSGDLARFTDDELRAVINLLARPGVVWQLAFGGWILLQPERVNAYAQGVIQTMREDEFERGCVAEERVLGGDLAYTASLDRLPADEERLVLLAMHQMLIERGMCVREPTDRGTLLTFPSYYRRERPELVGHPAVLVSYRFNGFTDEVYASLVVRLHHTDAFERDQLWRHAADFRTLMGRQLGIKLTRGADGSGELEVYFEPAVSMEEKIIFSKYVHEHLLRTARDVQRLRHYVCPHCGTPAGNREVAMRKLEEGHKDIPCVECDRPDRRIPLWDELEELFASTAVRERVLELQEQADVVLDAESKDRALVGEVVSTVALAGQISREFSVSDHGIDMEIEFKSEAGAATGRKVYLQLKSGDSYLTRRKRDGAEIFKIPKLRHAQYWMEQAFPVFLVIRGSEGDIRWMDVSDRLRRDTDDGKKTVRQIEFEGERFDAMSVRRVRMAILAD